MTDVPDPTPPADGPPAPKLPGVESPPRDDVLEGVPSKEDVVEQAQTADEVIADQPSVDEILGRDEQ